MTNQLDILHYALMVIAGVLYITNHPLAAKLLQNVSGTPAVQPQPLPLTNLPVITPPGFLSALEARLVGLERFLPLLQPLLQPQLAQQPLAAPRVLAPTYPPPGPPLTL
jgi:hypothetical protein